MAVFRVEKNKGYTVMSNHHLRNKELSLKAKGLLSQMLSLPEDWDYTLKGLSLINREKIDAIREAIKELEACNYPIRHNGKSNYKSNKEKIAFLGTPDHTDDIKSTIDIPSWKRMAVCILKNDHLCKYMGFSHTEDTIRRAHAVCPVTAIQNRYSMMARWHENLFPSLEELGIGFVAFSPLANGLLSACYDVKSVFNPQNDYRATMPQFKKESFEKNKPLLDLINHLADEHHATPAQISLAWMLQKKPWIVPIPGTRHLCRLKENAGAVDIKINPAEINQIDTALDHMDMSEVFGGTKIK